MLDVGGDRQSAYQVGRSILVTSGPTGDRTSVSRFIVIWKRQSDGQFKIYDPATAAVMLGVACRGAGPRSARASIDSAGLAALVDSVFGEGMTPEHVPGAAFVLVQNGRVVLEKGFGKAGVASERAVSPDRTLFPIASISKVFTATAVMQLADRGRIDLNVDVNRYLTSARVPPTYPQPVTATHLLTHTAGFDELPGRRVGNSTELVPLGRFLRERLIQVDPPGAVTSYSSYGMALAGLLVQDISGEPFEAYLERNIWEPLGMTRTFITLPGALRRDLATAYELEGEQPVPVPYELYQTPPTSSIVSTAADMARFMIAHLQNGRYRTRRI